MADAVCDVAVVGGGPAGAVAALSLARNGCNVVVLDAADAGALRVGETLGPMIRPALDRLGAWDFFEALGPVPSFGMRSAWGAAAVESSSFILSPYGQGWHVDRGRLDAMLLDRAGLAGATIARGVRALEIEREGAHFRLALADGGVLHARGVVDATGRSARVARKLGGRRIVVDHLVGVAARVGTTYPPGHFGLVEATEHGWWFSAPLPSHETLVAFMTDAAICRHRSLGDPRAWDAALARAEHTSARLGGRARTTRPAVFAALTHRLQRSGPVGGWLAVGDAAFGADPLSASGVERALRTGLRGAHALAAWLDGTEQELGEYEAALDSEFARYLRARAAVYADEERWSDAPFWSVRSGRHRLPRPEAPPPPRPLRLEQPQVGAGEQLVG